MLQSPKRGAIVEIVKKPATVLAHRVVQLRSLCYFGDLLSKLEIDLDASLKETRVESFKGLGEQVADAELYITVGNGWYQMLVRGAKANNKQRAAIVREYTKKATQPLCLSPLPPSPLAFCNFCFAAESCGQSCMACSAGDSRV
eukprot:4796502-Alexandrium_andersonii.AAC.1